MQRACKDVVHAKAEAELRKRWKSGSQRKDRKTFWRNIGRSTISAAKPILAAPKHIASWAYYWASNTDIRQNQRSRKQRTFTAAHHYEKGAAPTSSWIAPHHSTIAARRCATRLSIGAMVSRVREVIPWLVFAYVQNRPPR
jgi:hypothetical protein